jgi:hypothetical protein
MRNRTWFVAMLAAGIAGPALAAQEPTVNPDFRAPHQSMQLDLTGPFHTRSAWRLVVTEGPPTQDYGMGEAPGALALCLHKGPAGPCIADPVTLPLQAPTSDYAAAWEPHYLVTANAVYPRGRKAAPLLLIVTGSLNSGDGNQVIATQLVAYDANRDAFRRVYGQSTGHNNNEETRFVTEGPLRGSVISAVPQDHSPYGYWIVVNRFTPAGAYRQVLRYGSATRYNDGNPLAVIDSEMPNIERRLGLWKPGEPIPAPKLGGGGKPCLKPELRRSELWCR